MKKNKHAVIIVAGGQGVRMGHELPKQFIPLLGKPILMHSISCFHQWDPTILIVLVLPPSFYDYWKMLCEELTFTIPHQIVSGGRSRFHSVLNGLNAIDKADLIAIHDGVRPLVTQEVINNCFEDAARYGAAIPVVPVIESVREVEGSESHVLDRSKLRVIQTPQIFKADWLRQAYQQPYDPQLTDDASLVEMAGYTIHLSEGSIENMKITTPLDLHVAATLLTSRS